MDGPQCQRPVKYGSTVPALTDGSAVLVRWEVGLAAVDASEAAGVTTAGVVAGVVAAGVTGAVAACVAGGAAGAGTLRVARALLPEHRPALAAPLGRGREALHRELIQVEPQLSHTI